MKDGMGGRINNAIFLGETSFQRHFVEFENLEIAFFETGNPPGPLGLSEDNLAKKVVGNPPEGLS